MVTLLVSTVLGECKPATIDLGKYYILENYIEIRNMYYQEIKEEEFNNQVE